VSNQYPGQPGDVPPTQVAPGAGVPPQGYPPQQPPQGYPPQQPPQTPYGAPGGGGGYPPPPFGAPPTGGGGGKKIGLIIGIVVAVLVLIGGGITAAILLLGGDDDGDDDAKDPVTVTRTAETSATSDVTATATATEVTSSPTEVTSEPTDTGGLPAEDPQIVSQAYLDSLVTGNCLAVQGLSTPEWFSSEYGNQKGCKRASGNQSMSSAVYDFDEAVDNGDGTITQTATVTDSSDTSGTEYTATWELEPNDDNTAWLVDGFQLV
jgi:hypothetical protein